MKPRLQFPLAILIIGALTLACSSSPGSSGTAAAKDTLTVANSVDISTWDVQATTGIDGIVALANIYDRLVYLDADGTVKPWLATSWEVSADGKSWTFHLRKDAKFHDGEPVTAAAVKFSFERATGAGRPPSLARTYLSPITSIEIPDPYTVVLGTKAPFGPMLNQLGHQTAGVILNPKLVQAKNNDLTSPVDAGGGMYKLVEWKQGESLTLVRNEEWWGTKPYFKQIVYKPVSDPATRVVMLEKGDVDVATVLPTFEAGRLKQVKDIKLIETASIRTMFFAINVAKPPMNDVRVRQAVNYAVDVEAIVKSLLSGLGSRAQSMLPPDLPFYDPAYKFTYDPNKAKQLLTEAGVQAGTKLVIEAPQGRYPADAEITQAVADMLKAVGFDPQVMVYGDFARYQSTRPALAFHMSMTAWAAGSLDADGVYRNTGFTRAAQNYASYSDPNVDRLIDQGAGSTDPKARAAAYKQLEQVLFQQVPWLLLQNSISISGVRANICGVNVRGDDAHLVKDARTC